MGPPKSARATHYLFFPWWRGYRPIKARRVICSVRPFVLVEARGVPILIGSSPSTTALQCSPSFRAIRKRPTLAPVPSCIKLVGSCHWGDKKGASNHESPSPQVRKVVSPMRSAFQKGSYAYIYGKYGASKKNLKKR